MTHVHSCARCNITLYRCHELPIVDDCGAHCPNDPQDGHREYCEDCCLELQALEDDVNARMHEDEDAEEAQ